MNDVWELHLRGEFVVKNADVTMTTMTDDPVVNHVPVMTGGAGREQVRQFYATQFIPCMPPDFTITEVSRTIGAERVVDEMVIRFTHSMEMPWMLPGLAPTGRPVEAAVVAVVTVRDGRVASEHIYWDQASVLAQLGLLDTGTLPVSDGDSARKVLDPFANRDDRRAQTEVNRDVATRRAVFKQADRQGDILGDGATSEVTREEDMTTTQAETRVVVERMAEAAANLLASLSPDQRQKATFAFPDDEERRRWYYTPTDHGGLPLGEMTPTQQQRTIQLVATGLSYPGFVTASTIMGLENTLDRQENWRSDFFRERGRDPQLYYISIFGEPSGATPWGWRFGGHHISLHYTLVEGRIVAPTPTFFGANPAESPFVGAGTLRPLAGEEDLGRELLHLLDDGQRAVAVISPAAPWDLVTGNRPVVEDGQTPPGGWEIFREQYTGTDLERRRAGRERVQRELGFQPEHLEAIRHTTAPKGLAAARMNAGQRQALAALIDQYINRMPDELAAVERDRLNELGLEQIHFAWAGGAERRQPHYYRLQGPRFLVEYDNIQDNVNHIHSVWRDPEGDFGSDLLAQHYAAEHSR